MRIVSMALALLALAAPAVAQQDQRWRDPTGAWSLDFVASGWGHAEGLPANGPALLTMPMRPPGDGEVRMCLVEQYVAAREAGESDAQVRARAAAIEPAEAANAFPRMGLTNVSVTHADIAGQSVALVEGVSGHNRFRGRMFMTPAGDRIALSTIACISDEGMRPELDGEIDVILGTLQFNQDAP